LEHKFDPHQFADMRARRSSPSLRRAYQIMFLDLRGDDLKRAREWDLFIRFCEAGRLDINAAEVEMLDPPWPDLTVEVFGRPHYFEMGEVVPQDFLRADSKRGKTLQLEPSPLIPVWNPLETIIKKKMAKRYAAGSEPLSLVLYYERNDPIWDVLRPLVEERRAEIVKCFDAGNFDHLWLFLANEKRIPFSLSKRNIAMPTR
jgi:hypothetical protein